MREIHKVGTKIELTSSQERYRNRVLAEVGLGNEYGDDGDSSDNVGHEHEKDRHRNTQKEQPVLKHKNSPAESGDGADIDDILHDVNNLEYKSFCHSDSDNDFTWPADLAKRIMVKLIWITLAVAAIIFIFHKDDEFINKPENIEAGVEQKRVPYSHKGYKNARIPDDEVAQHGGGVLGGEVFGINSKEYSMIEDGESDVKDNESEQ